MSLRTLPLLALAIGCVSTEPSGHPLTPARVQASPRPVPAGTARPPVDAGDPDSPFVEDDPFTELPDPGKEPSGADAVLKGLLTAPPPEATPAPAPMPAPAPVAPAPPPIPQWDGQTPLDDGGGWGLVLLGTMLDVQPPRAVVALPDGSERVVQPGAFLPEHQMVVLAIGRDAVQVAHITPMGFKSRIETTTVRSLFAAP